MDDVHHGPESVPVSKPSGYVGTFLFQNTVDPTKPQSSGEKREMRRHVMNDYLKKTNRKDTRPSHRGRRNAPVKPVHPKATHGAFCVSPILLTPTPRSTRAKKVHFNLMPQKSPPDQPQSAIDRVDDAQNESSEPCPESQIHIAAPTSQPTLLPRNEHPNTSKVVTDCKEGPYLMTHHEQVPCPISMTGSKINPFDTWPKLEWPLTTERLKYNCSRYFGSAAMSEHWIPLLLTARHAFLSTICVSATHGLIMQKASNLPASEIEPTANQLYHVNSQINEMINSALGDPVAKLADYTIAAVLQVMVGDMMLDDVHVLDHIQEGLYLMIWLRGGLDNLDDYMASMLTINMYLVSAIHERPPSREFENWATKNGTKPPDDQKPIPESPVYCRSGGFDVVRSSLSDNSPALELLDILRRMTNNFVRATEEHLVSPITPTDPSMAWSFSPRVEFGKLFQKVFSMKDAANHPTFQKMNASHGVNSAQYVYEAIRLAGHVYAYALGNTRSFSSTALTLSRNKPVPIHVRIKEALQHTDLDQCWGDMVGVLLWTSLIGRAAANTNSSTYTKTAESRDNQEDDDLSRQYLTALAVRCVTRLGFEHGGSVLETIRRMVRIEQLLIRLDEKQTVEMLDGIPYLANFPLDSMELQTNTNDELPQDPLTSPLLFPTFGPPPQPFDLKTFVQDFRS